MHPYYSKRCVKNPKNQIEIILEPTPGFAPCLFVLFVGPQGSTPGDSRRPRRSRRPPGTGAGSQVLTTHPPSYNLQRFYTWCLHSLMIATASHVSILSPPPRPPVFFLGHRSAAAGVDAAPEATTPKHESAQKTPDQYDPPAMHRRVFILAAKGIRCTRASTNDGPGRLEPIDMLKF